MRPALMVCVCAVVVILVVPLWVVADDPTPTPTPEPTPTPTPRPATLADLAKDRELNTEVLNDDGAIVIIKPVEDEASAQTAPNRPADQVPGLPGMTEEERRISEEEKKAYWQQEYLKQLEEINLNKRKIEILDERIPELQNKFYRWDDPAYRDGVIKPELDQAMADRERYRAELGEAQEELARIKQDARRDGALPGWFRGLTAIKAPDPDRDQQ